jgi:hypothetical protein
MDWNIIIKESLWISLVVSVALTVMITGSLLWNKEMWLSDFPPDVKAKWGPMSDKAKRQRNIFAVPFMGLMIGALVYIPFRLATVLGSAPSFAAIFVSVAMVLLIFNLVDAFIIDLGFLYLWPGLMVLPGTEGMAGYRDMGFWARNLRTGLVITVVAGLIVAGVASLVMWIGTLL